MMQAGHLIKKELWEDLVHSCYGMCVPLWALACGAAGAWYPPPPCISHALVQATVGVGTVIIVYVI